MAKSSATSDLILARQRASNQKYSFLTRLKKETDDALFRGQLSTLQINLGKLCNQACHHCHVEAGPKRTEIMTQETADNILGWIKKQLANGVKIDQVDLTGGAPELIPVFRGFVDSLLEMGITHIISRCNLTVIFEPNQNDLPEWYAKRKIHVVSSLPCYTEDNVDEQRGKGVFDKSIKALQLLNEVGYGRDKSLILDLVFNPNGAYLPGDQTQLEMDYKKHLSDHFDIDFSHLLALANLPVKRFEHFLVREGIFDDYMNLLSDNFNTATVDSLMCKNTLSVDWEGRVYDCDFNQMLELPKNPKRLWDINPEQLEGKAIPTGFHCFGCTAGTGSSCGGTLS